MGYRHIENLYRPDAQRILEFRRLYVTEKVHGCVKKGTPIRLANGQDTPIETVRSGDAVISYNEATQQFLEATVGALVVQERDVRLGWVEVTLQDGRGIICTEDHPILTTNRGWVPAAQLTISDDILTA